MSDAEEKESLARSQLPYKAEYCKSNRAKCKKCSEPMMVNTLKLANMVKSRFHDGHDANFYHVNCFFQIKRPTSVAEIGHFETLKYEDQKMLEKAIETNGTSVLGDVVKAEPTDKEKTDKKSKKSSKKRDAEAGERLVNYNDFLVEYAKSSRAVCIKCQEKIEKSVIRIGKLDYSSETHWKAGPVPRWYHTECFAKSLDKLEFYGDITKIQNFSDLQKEDQKVLKDTIKIIKPPDNNNESTSKKVKTEEQSEEEELLKKQSRRFYRLREHVQSMKHKDIEEMLKNMGQKSNYKSSSTLIDMATDILLFGPLANCPKCSKAEGMVLRGSSYICMLTSEDKPCTYETREPKRGVPDVPEEIMDKYEVFEYYKFKGGARIFPSKLLKAVEQKEAEDNNIVQEGAPLSGISIGVIAWNSVKTDKSKVQKRITTLGGKLLTSVEKSIFVILSNEDEVSKNNPKVEVAKALNIPFVTEDFLFKIESKEDVVPQVKKCILAEWDGDIKKRFDSVIPK